MKLKFVVNRAREDEHQQLVECVIDRPQSLCEKVDCYGDAFDEKSYDRFTMQVPSIVSAISGLDCGCEWFFDEAPHIV